MGLKGTERGRRGGQAQTVVTNGIEGGRKRKERRAGTGKSKRSDRKMVGRRQRAKRESGKEYPESNVKRV